MNGHNVVHSFFTILSGLSGTANIVDDGGCTKRILPILAPLSKQHMAEQTHLKQSLGLMDGTLIVVGSMIGSGIFIVSADITRNVGSAGWLIAVWLITGFMTLTAALSYG